MDAPAAESNLNTVHDSMLARQRTSVRASRFATLGVATVLAVIIAFSTWVLTRNSEPGSLLSPPLVALLLVANLIPAIALMVLYSRRIARRRAQREGLGSGILHARLVTLFSILAAVPTVLVVIFASVLFQNGIEFWFSDRAKTVLAQAENTSRIYAQEHSDRIEADLQAMGIDIVNAINEVDPSAPEFERYFLAQRSLRQIDEVAILRANADNRWTDLLSVNYDDRPIYERFSPEEAALLSPGETSIKVVVPDRVEGLIRLDQEQDVFLYGSRAINAQAVEALAAASAAAGDYSKMLQRGRTLQLRFNAAMLLGSLLVVGLAIFAALKLADRLVRPVGQLVTAAGRIEEGDFSARVPVTGSQDEIQTLASAFNRMTGRLEEQTGALISANAELEARGAFMEAVLSSVTAGVVALDLQNRVLLSNRSAEALLQHDGKPLEGADLSGLSPELAEFMAGDEREANVLVLAEGGQRMLAVKRVRYQDGTVITFDDITDQLSDQRRAAWSDIARRIAHEIKNPLTPIQLAAERLQRRFSKEVTSEPETFERLTGTIVRQVGDLRRMVDEFSNFARMPKPVFRRENVHEIARQALFLHEVAHPALKFVLDPAEGEFSMVCDRRQLGQALSNVVKNAVEAIEARRSRGEHNLGGDRVELKLHRDGAELVIDVMDTGVGLPEERERLTEPYITTRVRGTGLGLAIVKKIVEEHLGEIAFLDRSGGGTHVRIAFDAERLEALESEMDSEGQSEPAGDNGETEE